MCQNNIKVKPLSERILDVTQGAVGQCPFCNSTLYERDFGGMDGDAASFFCECECGEVFDEFFCLAYQQWVPNESEIREPINA
jgi:hypothetical protein